jgi:predicted transporter
MTLPPIDFNWLAVIAAAASAFLLGGIWYGPLFKKAWCREAGVDPDSAPRHPARIFAIAIVCSLLSAVIFAAMMPSGAGAADGFGLGFVVGLFFVAMSFGINYAFAQRSLKLWMIDSGYHILQFILYGVILGAWR